MEQISELIQKGENVKIVDNKSGEDLTEKTLLQIIRLKVKTQKMFSVKALMELIRSGTSASNDFFYNIKTEVDNRINDMKAISDIKSIIENYHKHFLDWQNKLDSQIKSTIENYSGIVSKEIFGIKNRISKLENLVQELKNKLDDKNSKKE